MDPFYWAVLAGGVVLALVIAGAIVWAVKRRRDHQRLHNRFGVEYDRIVDATGDRRAAEEELIQREDRVKNYDIRPLSPDQRRRYAETWREVQADFVDAPASAVGEADTLVTEVMRQRGYPMADFEQRAADLSVDHPVVVENYRAAHDLAVRNQQGNVNTENLRRAMIHYRKLFEELLEESVSKPAEL